jgi:hypothetical protein
MLLCSVVYLVVFANKGASSNSEGGSNSEIISFNDLDIKTQSGKIQVANYGDQPLWLAYIVSNGAENIPWPIYPKSYKGIKNIQHKSGVDGAGKPQAAGSVRIDPGQCALFPMPDTSITEILNGRMWPMLGCNDQNQSCSVGCSSLFLGLEKCGYGDEGTTTTAPIDSKLEFTICKNKGADYFNISGVDGITLPYSFEWVGDDDEVYQIDAALPQIACPTNEPIYEGCSESNCPGEPTYKINLQHTNTKSQYLGCFSPCAYLTNGNRVNFPQCKPNQTPTPSLSCCPHDGGNDKQECTYYCCGNGTLSEACNGGPINQTQWCKTIHEHSRIVKFPTDLSAVGKPGIYCQAFDDGIGLKSRASSENAKYKLIFRDTGFEWAGKPESTSTRQIRSKNLRGIVQ